MWQHIDPLVVFKVNKRAHYYLDGMAVIRDVARLETSDVHMFERHSMTWIFWAVLPH